MKAELRGRGSSCILCGKAPDLYSTSLISGTRRDIFALARPAKMSLLPERCFECSTCTFWTINFSKEMQPTDKCNYISCSTYGNAYSSIRWRNMLLNWNFLVLSTKWLFRNLSRICIKRKRINRINFIRTLRPICYGRWRRRNDLYKKPATNRSSRE